MKAELDQKELNIISDNVYQKIKNQLISEGNTKVLEETAKKFVNSQVEWYLSDNTLSADVRDVIKPIFMDFLKQNPDIMSQCIFEHMNTKKFKELEIKQLRNRIFQLEREEE